MGRSGRQTIEDVARNAIDRRISEAVGPVGDTSVEDGASTRSLEQGQTCVVVRHPVDVGAPLVAEDRLGRVLELTGLVRVARRLLFLAPEAGRGGRPHLQRLR